MHENPTRKKQNNCREFPFIPLGGTGDASFLEGYSLKSTSSIIYNGQISVAKVQANQNYEVDRRQAGRADS